MHVEVQADFVQRERDVLAGFGFDLHFELVFGQAGRQDDFLGDDGGRRHAERDVLGLAAAFFPDAQDRIRHRFDVFDVAVDDGAARQRLGRHSAPAALRLCRRRQLHQSHAGRTDVDPDQRRVGLSEQGT